MKKSFTKACARLTLPCRWPGVPIDTVSRFLLGNGARLQQLNWLADVSEKGLRQSPGMMVGVAPAGRFQA